MLRFWSALVCCLFSSIAFAAEDGEAQRSASPDGKWEYRVVEEQGAIVRAGTEEVALVLADRGGTLAVETGRVLWAPDSRRVAFNYQSGGRYYTCSVYELTGDEWKALPDLEEGAAEVTKMIERAGQRDRKRLGVGKKASRRSIREEWRVRRWINPDTFEAVALSSGSVVVNKKTEDVEYIGGAVLFTVKCDNRGGWKISRQRELSDADLEKMGNEDGE